MNRRQFVASLGAASLATGCRFKGDAKGVPPVGSLGANDFAHGHKLRSGGLPEPTRERHVEVAIVGGGIAGLGCAWQLERKGMRGFELFELEREIGGNSRSGQSAVGGHPLGAHYLPIPSSELVQVRELLAELGVLKGDPTAERPEYDEAYLCAAPQERLLAGGIWHDGLLPDSWIPPAERLQVERFHARMDELKQARGSDGRMAFAFPMRESSTDPVWTDLDKISMRAWMQREGFSGQELAFHADYACRDDFGTTWDQVSAWAGIHYFAARRGKASNAEDDAYLVRPEGNSWLARALAARLGGRIRTGKMAFAMQTENGKPFVDILDTASGRTERIRAERVVWASPIYPLRHVWRDMPLEAVEASKEFSHAPWVVANLELSRHPADRPGAPLSWDNVFRESRGLGYVVANHQVPRVLEGALHLTWYMACTERDPVTERMHLQAATREEIAEMVLADLEQAHPDIRSCCTRLDVWRWGHAMVRPTVGFLWHSRREWFERQTGRILFAHSDLSGMSLFEEALSHGVRAADSILVG